MAVIGSDPREGTWRVVQHEGFHQFVHRVLSGRVPIWVNEGMAEYFAQGVWTGDSYVMGVIPPGKLKQVKSLIKSGKMLPFLEMMEMTSRQWQSNLASRNYAQAWAMVHFLAHAEDDKYQKAFNAFLSDVAAARLSWRQAFVRHFGRDVEGFQKRFADWWTSLPDDPTADLYSGAVVQTLTSFLARAHGQGQRFEDVEGFFQAARDGTLKEDPKLWLPRTLLQRGLNEAKKLSEWKLVKTQQGPGVRLSLPDGTTFTGTFRIKPGSAVDASVRMERAKASSRPAPEAAGTRRGR